MKRVFLIFIFLIVSMLGFSQNQKSNSDSCYSVKQKDTIWETKCIQVQPSFPGGDAAYINFMTTNVKYPKLALEMGIEGKIWMAFQVNNMGLISNVEIYKSTVPRVRNNGKEIKEKDYEKYKIAKKELEDEALRVTAMMPKWIPGTASEKNVNAQFYLPLVFKIQ